MPLSALTRVCPICHVPLPDPPAAAACGSCRYVGAPHHTMWPPVVKWWLLSELAVGSFLPWLNEQSVWELKLQAALLGGIVGPNPWSLRISTSTPPVALYPLALERAHWWKSAGSPIARRVLGPTQQQDQRSA